MSVEVTLRKACAYGTEGKTLRVAKSALAGMLSRGEIARNDEPKPSPKPKKKAKAKKSKKAAE